MKTTTQQRKKSKMNITLYKFFYCLNSLSIFFYNLKQTKTKFIHYGLYERNVKEEDSA